MRQSLCLLPLLLALAGCAGPSITLNTLEPADADDVTRLQRLAVVRFRNDQGGVATAAVENALTSVIVSGKQYFRLVDSRIQPDYLNNQGVEMSFDAPSISRYGRSAGADGVVLGTVSTSDYRDERTTEQRSVCVSENESGSCKKLAVRKVRCTVRTGEFSFTPKVVNVASGRIIISREFTETEESTDCRGVDDDRLESGAKLVSIARQRAIERFLRLVAPHTVQVRVPLLTSDDQPMSESVKASIASGVNFAEAGRMDRACGQWRMAGQERRVGYALPYLDGVCAEFAGDLGKAKAAYEEADRRSTQPVGEISQALARVRRSMDNAARLDSQLK